MTKKCNDTVLNVNIFLKKLCIREQIECVDAYELFTKQGNVLKSLFDNLGRIVHIPTTEFGKLHFTWCIACLRLILTWS
jgi:hypothetical protein